MSVTNSPKKKSSVSYIDGELAKYIPPKKRIAQEADGQALFPGNEGKSCELRVNHVRMKLPQGEIYQYSVNIIPPWEREYKKSDKEIYQKVINEWRHVSPVAKNDPYCWVFDGHTTLYSTKAHKGVPNCDVSISIDGRMETFTVTDIKIDTTIMINDELAKWARKAQSGNYQWSMGGIYFF